MQFGASYPKWSFVFGFPKFSLKSLMYYKNDRFVINYCDLYQPSTVNYNSNDLSYFTYESRLDE